MQHTHTAHAYKSTLLYVHSQPRVHPSTPPKTNTPQQTYEGGLGGEPDNEAHGGYTYCGTAALLLLGEVEVLDIPRLLHWLVFKQVWGVF